MKINFLALKGVKDLSRWGRGSLLLIGLVWLQFVMSSAVVHAQGHVLPPREKATPEIVEASKRGEIIEVGIEFEVEDIHQEEERRRRARGLEYLDEDLKKEARINYGRLKKSLLDDIKGEGYQLEVLLDTENVPVVLVRIKSFGVLQRIIKDPRVKAVHEIRKISPATIQSLPLIGQPYAFSANKNGQDSRIAIIDTRPNLAASVFSHVGGYPACTISGSNFLGGDEIGTGQCKISNLVDFSGESCPSCWNFWSGYQDHGTKVAGIAGLVAPSAKLAILNVYPSVGRGSESMVVNAINWIVNNSSLYPRIVAANFSLSLSEGVVFSEECSNYGLLGPYFSRLIANGVIPVVATGNDGSENGVSYPACLPGAVRVGAVYDANSVNTSECPVATSAQTDKVWCGSNGGKLVTLLAPGSEIMIPVCPNCASIGGAGTSLAAPHVSGSIAILRGSTGFYADSINATMSRLIANGKLVTDYRSSSVKPRINIQAALFNSAPPYVITALPAMFSILKE